MNMTLSRAENPSLIDLMMMYFKEEMPSRKLRRDSFKGLYIDGNSESFKRIGVLPISSNNIDRYITVDMWTIGMVGDDRFQAFGGGSPLFYAADPEFFPKLSAHVEKVLAELKPGDKLVV